MPKLPNPRNFSSTTKTAILSLLSIQSRLISSCPPSSSTSFPVPTQEHIARLILDQKSPSQALKTFKWASELSNFTHSQSTYRALIHKLCTFRRFDTAQQLLDEMPDSIGHPPDEDIFVTIIRGLGRARMIKDVIKVLDLVSKFNSIPSLKIFNSILDVLVKEDIDLAREFYRKKMMASGVQGDDYTFGILMKGLCLTNRIGDGFKLLQLMKSRGVTPNTVIYNTLITSLCKNGKVGTARTLMNQMQDPNDITFNIMISAYCKEEHVAQALVMVEKSFNKGFVPDVISVTKVLEVLCNAGRVTEAAEVLERVEKDGGKIDVVAYNTLLKGYCRLGKVKVGLRILKEMEHKGCLPNVDTYNFLISGFCDSGMLDSALDMFNDMKTVGITWSFVTFDTLIKGLFSGGRVEEGFKILELMEERKGGSGGRISPYNSVLYGLYKENRLEEALEFLTKMENLFPRAVDRSFRILGFCADHSVEDAKRVYDQMTGEGGNPSALVYDSLINGFCQEGCLLEAIEIMNEMVSSSYFPVSSTFNGLISGFCQQGKAVSALNLKEDMVKRGCIPDVGSYSLLIDAFCKEEDSHKALELLFEMVEKDIIPDYLTWNSLLLCISQERAWLLNKSMSHVHNQLQCITDSQTQ